MPAASIYLDHNATTPIDPRVALAMTRAWRDCGANPASQHAPGRHARRMLEKSREGILELLGAKTGGMDADQLIFTSGGTEANNLALLGLSSELAEGDLVISAFEHPSVRGAAEVVSRTGAKLTVFKNVEEIYRDFDLTFSHEGGLLISLMLANNETGIIYPMQEVSDECECSGARIHTDAVQAAGKIAVNFHDLRVDAMTVAPHKFHGPLGIGALIVRHGVKLQPQLYGGFQQSGLRPGTENVALAVGFHEALRLAIAELPERAARMTALRDELESTIKEYGRQECLPHTIIGADAPRLPNTSCVSFPGLNRQALVMALDLAGVACSTGSACASGSSEPSPTLIAMGLPREVVEGAIRVSLGAFTTAAEVAEASRRIINAVKHLRSQKTG
jgi:cysteine desulfurase